MLENIYLALIVAAAGFLQGLTGFGFVLIALPLLSFFLGIKVIIPLVCLLSLCISLYLCIQLRDNIKTKYIRILFVASLPAIFIGAYSLKHIPAQWLSLFIGFLMIGFTSFQLISKPSQTKLGLLPTTIAGFLSGLLGGSIGAGGPPVIIYANLQPWNKHETKATLATFFLISGATVSTSHAYYGMISAEVIQLFVLLLPALALGVMTGIWAYTRISDSGYKNLAIMLVFLLGLMMVFRNL